MKPTKLLEKYKKKEKARVKAGFKAKNGEDKLSRFLAGHIHSNNNENEIIFIRYIKNLERRGLVKNFNFKILKNKIMTCFDAKNPLIQYLIEKKKKELGIYNKIVKN